MCFSPEMDLVAGLTVTAVGIDTLRRTTGPRHLPLASLPLLFGVHQLVETFVWWELQGAVCHTAGGIAARTYLFIALFLVPIVVPTAFALMRVGRWPIADWFFVACGTVSGVVGLYSLAHGPVGRAIDGHHITYSVGLPAAGIVLFLYSIATCAPGIAARSRNLVLFGIANLVAVVTLVALAQTAVISLWCVWAAFTSVLINLHLRRSLGTTRTAEWAARPQPYLPAASARKTSTSGRGREQTAADS